MRAPGSAWWSPSSRSTSLPSSWRSARSGRLLQSTSPPERAGGPAAGGELEGEPPAADSRPVGAEEIAAVLDALEQGSGLPEAARALGRALQASVLISDASGATLALAARSSGEERALRAGGSGVRTCPLTIAGERVGTLVLRARCRVEAELMRVITLLLAAEVRQLRLPSEGRREGAAALLGQLFADPPPDLELAGQQARELGLEIASGAGLVMIRAHAQSAVGEDWRERCLGACERALAAELLALVGASGEEELQRLSHALFDELRSAPATARVVVGSSRLFHSAQELARAAAEALLSANVAEGEQEGDLVLAFEQTGAYRLLLPAMRENVQELERFYAETIAPLLAYDRQYETALVRTLAVFLEADGNVAAAAQRLFTHRHTVYYRLERIKELSSLDVSSSEGREKLSLGLKAMRVLGIGAGAAPGPQRSGGRGAGGGRSEQPRGVRR